MKINIIILNGPPGCGKDFGADFLCSTLRDAKHHTMKAEVKPYIITYLKEELRLSKDDIERFFFDSADEDTKDTPHVKYAGMSPRDIWIRVSEKIVKPKMGKRHFGASAADTIAAAVSRIPASIRLDEIRDDRRTFVFSDGGFDDEIIGLIRGLKRSEELKLGKVMVLKIFREGCTFEKDARSYLDIGKIELETATEILDRSVINDSYAGYLGGLARLVLRAWHMKIEIDSKTV